MTRRLLAVSPHLDDAAFSVGGTLAAKVRAGWSVTVLTCFTGNVARPRGFALACQLDKGLGEHVDYMAIRREEDIVACAAIGADAIHLPFLEAPHRGYENAAALFGSRLADDDLARHLAPALTQAIRTLGPDLILGPLAIGDHVDHQIVRDALSIAAEGVDLLSWEDWPYLDRSGAPASRPASSLPLDAWLRERRLAMCEAYRSQIGYQFGSHEKLAARIAAVDCERLYRA